MHSGVGCGWVLSCYVVFHYSFTFLSLFPQASSSLFAGLSFGFPVSLVYFLPHPLSFFCIYFCIVGALSSYFYLSYYSFGVFPNLTSYVFSVTLATFEKHNSHLGNLPSTATSRFGMNHHQGAFPPPKRRC